jgi:fibronectin type 3 domain-containing protein
MEELSMKKFRIISLLLTLTFIISIFIAIPANAASISVPKNVKASAISTSSIKLTWSAVKGAKSYEIQRYDTKKKKYVKIATTKIPKYVNTDLKSNTSYKYKIRAIKGSKKSGFSKIVSVKTLISSPDPKVPSPEDVVLNAPTNLKVNVIDYKTISLNWDAVNNANKYKIYVSKDSPSEGFSYLCETVEVSVALDGLEYQTKYYFRVTANNDMGESRDSAYISATPELQIPTNFIAEVTDRILHLSWDPVVSAEMYKVCIMSKFNSGGTSLGTNNNIFIPLDQLHLLENTEYEVYVYAMANYKGSDYQYISKPTKSIIFKTP